jgi:hypothetical protein
MQLRRMTSDVGFKNSLTVAFQVKCVKTPTGIPVGWLQNKGSPEYAHYPLVVLNTRPPFVTAVFSFPVAANGSLRRCNRDLFRI